MMVAAHAHGLIDARLPGEADRAAWRALVRRLIAAENPPEQVRWSVGNAVGDLFGGATCQPLASEADPALRVPRDLIADIDTALLHRDPTRFDLCYRLIWRNRLTPGFHLNPADADVHALRRLAKSVRRDIHKMHAFVRFRRVGEDMNGRERFAAWFEPDHHITEAVAKFFRNRFTGMDWLIVTPEASIAWDGQALSTGPGGSRADVPADDAIEAEWRAYYASIFNPARVKVNAMKSEMPVKYWRNLPEARLIQPLIAGANARVADMVAADADEAVKLMPVDSPSGADDFATLAALYRALAEADDAPRTHFSDVLVPGEGPLHASLMFVGEQPGDQEDLAGRPFVGPAGQLFDRALDEAGVARGDAFVTNAVKRFKFEPRGKRRIHSKPTNDEIAYYRWWLDQERRLVQPRVIVALGASAVRALTGKTLTISRVRGEAMPYLDGSQLLVTVHPSFLLRLPDESAKRIEYGKFVRDLERAHALL